jgi:hypothetical protein
MAKVFISYSRRNEASTVALVSDIVTPDHRHIPG